MNYDIGINLSQMGGQLRETQSGRKVVVIPADADGISVNSGGVWLNLVAWASEQPKWGTSHVLKQSLPKEKYGTKTPYVGNMREKVRRQPDNDDLPFD